MPLTNFDGSPVVRPFSWSFSKLDAYRTCAKKYYHAQVKKDHPEVDNEHMRWGNRVHDAMAKRIVHSTPLPDGMQQWEKWAQWALTTSDGSPPAPGTDIKCEQKLAITDKFQPCDYFDRRVNVWFRTVADVLKLGHGAARVIDWKTGKVKENSDQIALTAVVIMAMYPEVDRVLGQYVWLQHDVKHEELFRRADIPIILSRCLPDVMKMEQAMTTGEWPAKPSGLCKKYCSVISCPYYKRGAY